MSTPSNHRDDVLAIVPARGGSKGLPGKNIMDLCGKPLIAWTIEAALAAEWVGRVVVSTDDEAIADVSRKFGADVPFMRPAALATDESTSMDALIHCLGGLRDNEGYAPDIVIVLQATSPLRGASLIDEMIGKFVSGGHDSMVSVTEVTEPPWWMKRLDSEGRMIPLMLGEDVEARRQDYESIYIPSGAMYVARTDYLVENRGFYTAESRAFIMPHEDSVDIDDMHDFHIAECLMSSRSE